MAFLAEHILYDGISSERFGLQLYNDNGGLDTTSGSSFSILRSSLQGGLQYVYLGREDKEPIPMKLQMVSKKPLDAAMQGVIHKWLIGKSGYKELRFVQPDMSSWRIGCIFHEIEYIQNGNMTVGVSVTGECDSCYFRGNDIITEKSGESGSFVIMNLSDCSEYVYPTLDITMPSGGGDLSMTNLSDNGREFLIAGLSGDEGIWADNLRKILTSSSSFRRLANFNKKWFRLLPGKNEITYTFSGGIGSIRIITPVYRMAGQ